METWLLVLFTFLAGLLLAVLVSHWLKIWECLKAAWRELVNSAEEGTSARHLTQPVAQPNKGFKPMIHQKVLQQQRAYCDLYLREEENVQTCLWARGIITDEQSAKIRKHIERGEPDLARVTILEILSASPRMEDFFGFLESLENSNQEHLANSLRKEFQEESRKSLQKMYDVRCGRVPRKPWIEDDMMDINSIFINLELIERQDHRKVDHPEQFRDYTKIFDNEDFKKCKKCVISGDPGSGKTTLASKIAFDWANQKLGQFDYVLVVKLREIANQGGLLCHLSNMYSDSGVISMLESGKHGPVLLILDGLDEMNHLVNSEFGEFLEGKIFPAMQLLITTRPHSLPVLKKYPHITLNVKGFRSQDIEMYIEKYFEGKNPDRASQVIMQCVRHNHLWNLVENPLCCLMLCFLYESRYADKPDNYTMPNNVIELYTELVAVFQEIYERKWPSENWNDLFKRLGQLAMDMLVAEKYGVLIFEDKLLQSYGIEPTEACRAGLVTRIESIKGQTSTGSSAVSQSKTMYYSFIHKSLQEFTAALYAFSCTQEECAKLSSQIADLDYFTFRSLDLFIRFTFDVACTNRRGGGGVHGERNICSMLLAKSAEYVQSESFTRDYVYKMMSEICIKNKPHLCEVLTREDRFQYLLAAFKLKSYMKLRVLEEEMILQYHCVLSALVTQDITEKLLDHVIHISMRELFRDGEPNVSGHEMSVLIPFVNSFALTSANLETMQLKTVIQARDLTVIDLVQCKFNNQISLCECLSCIHWCQKLNTFRVCRPVLSETGKTPQSESDMISMFKGKQPLPVKVLELSGCPERLSLVYLQQVLPLCTQLTSLTLSCDTSQDLHAIFLTLPGSLKVLKLTGSGVTEIDVVTLLNRIDKLKSLELLSMCGVLIRITDIKINQESTKVLCYGEKSYCDNLRQLTVNLSQYCGDLEVLFQTLSKCSHRLDFNITGVLIDNQMCHHIKSTAVSLVGINMRACRLGGLNPENVKETCESLKQLKSLDVSMIKGQAGQLHEIVSTMPNSLEVLDISHSDISGESLEHLSEFIRRKDFKKFKASGIMIQHDKATSCELSFSFHDCTKFTIQILRHCLRKLNISMLKLSSVMKDSFIDGEIKETLLYVLLSLDRLSLSHCDIECLEDFISHLDKNSTQLRELYLSRNSFTEKESVFFSLLHSLSTSLEVLDLSGCHLTTNSVRCILKELCRFTQLRKLNLSENSLEYVESEFCSLSHSLSTSLEVLDLSWCDLTTNSVQCVLKELCRFTQLRELNLSGNSLEDVESEFYSLSPSLSTSLEVLHLSDCELTTNSVQCILKELCRFTQLRELNLSENSLEDVENVFYSLSPSLPTSLEVLDLSWYDLTTNSVQCVLKELCRFTQLRELNLSGNSLEDVESEFYSLSPSLSTSLEVLDLSECHLTTNSVQCVLLELCRFTQLRELNLSENSLKDVESEFISTLPFLSVSLEVLRLVKCKLSTNCMQALMHQLPRLTHLGVLNISCIKLPDSGWQGVLAVVRELPPCSGRVTVYARKCGISEDIKRQLKNCRQDMKWYFQL